MTKTKVTFEENNIKVETPYDMEFIRFAHTVKGDWDGEAWNFDKKYEDKLSRELAYCFNEPLKAFDGVEVKLDLDNAYFSDGVVRKLKLGSRTIATKFARDEKPYFADTFSHFEKGSFKERGGSSNNPEVTWEDGSILVTKVPAEELEAIKEEFDGAIEVVDQAAKKQILESKREQLLSELNKLDEDINAEEEVKDNDMTTREQLEADLQERSETIKDNVRLAQAVNDGELDKIYDDDKLDIDMIYQLALRDYVDNYDPSDDDENVAEWLSTNSVKFKVNGNADFANGKEADEIVKIENYDALRDKLFDIDRNIVD